MYKDPSIDIQMFWKPTFRYLREVKCFAKFIIGSHSHFATASLLQFDVFYYAQKKVGASCQLQMSVLVAFLTILLWANTPHQNSKTPYKHYFFLWGIYTYMLKIILRYATALLDMEQRCCIQNRNFTNK